ncbi:MAG TPA: RidA family protein [Hyphomicrobiaceae bacterium]|nr:RidA family protein [Hyphomicrobiaceae bacterium]
MPKSGVSYVNPPSAGPAQGMYSHVARMTPGEIAFIAGQVAIDASGTPVGVGDVAAQVPVVFDNLGKILKDLGADFEAVVQFTTYLTSADYIPAFMAARAAVFPTMFPGGKYPPNTLLIVGRLVKPEFLIEVEAIARLPG